MNTVRLRAVVLVAVCTFATGCAASKIQPGTATRAHRYKLPVYTLASGTQAQTRGAVTAQVTKPDYSATIVPFTLCTQSRYFAYDAFTAGGRLYDVHSSQRVVITPREGFFEIRLTNGLANVLRLDGAILTTTANGDERRVELTEAQSTGPQRTILPGHSATFFVRAPVAKDGTPSSVSFAIYDLVTATDAAGNPTARSTYEWAYRAGAEERSAQITSSIDQRKLTREDERLCAEGEARWHEATSAGRSGPASRGAGAGSR